MAGSGSDVKACWYSVLGVERTATPEEIRSTYRKVALKWHPDKIQQSGASAKECEESTVRFQTIVQAYEVLSDPVERSWYDKYRNEILSSGSVSKDFEFNVFSFFSPSAFSGFGETGKGFYKVYKDVFVNIHKKEQAFAKAYCMGPIGEAPLIGSPSSSCSEVEEFYKYWTGFTTVKDFSWWDQHQVSQASSRKVRRLMEEENAKIRKKERREFNDAVRDLATFVKKRDKRWLVRQVELQRLQKDKDLQFKLRKQQLQQEKISKARSVEEQEWTKIPNIEEEDDAIEDINEGSYIWKSSNNMKVDDEHLQEFYCIICSKRFRSEKQWKNHERSKKHNEKAAILKRSFLDVKDADLEGYVYESSEDHRCMPAGHSEDGTTGKYQDAEGSAQSRARQESWASKRDSDNLDENPVSLESNSTRSKQNDGRKTHDYSEGDEDETLGDEEGSMLAAMMNTFKTRLAVPPAKVEATRDLDVDVHEPWDVSRGQSGSDASLDSDGENAVDDNDQETLVAPLLKSNRRQSRFFYDEENGTENPAESQSQYPEAGSSQADEEEITPRGNLGKTNSRRKSKAKMRHLAAERRHFDLLKELSCARNSAGEVDDTQPIGTLSVEDSGNTQLTSNQKKKKLQRGPKKRQPGVPSAGVVATVSPQREPVVKKGCANGKKGKQLLAKPANTCETCGEDFDSRLRRCK